MKREPETIAGLKREVRGALLGQIGLEVRIEASIRALAERVERVEWLLDWLKQQVGRDVRVVVEPACQPRHPRNFRGGRKT